MRQIIEVLIQKDLALEAVRVWFCCYLPEEVRTIVAGPDLARGIVLFQDLDEFLSSLMVSAFERASEAQ